jgi:putative transposase
MIAVRKLKIIIDETDIKKLNDKYKFIRDAQYAQYLGLNRAVSFLASPYLKNVKDRTEYNEAVKLLTNSNSIFDDINFGTGIDSKSTITNRVKKDFKTDIKNGLARGERTIRNYKRTYPLLTRGRDIRFFYDGEDIKIKWVNKIVFKVILGKQYNKNDMELKHFLHKVIDKAYKISESSIYFNDKKIMLNLATDIPIKTKNEFIQGRVVGVDIGVKIPAYVALNDTNYIKKGIGSYNDFMKTSTQIKNRYNRIQRLIKSSSGGKGRNKKLSALKRFEELQGNFNRTYNHFLSKEIIKFARDNNAGQINLELLSMKEATKGTILNNWPYYQLQQMIEYKAEREGIKVCYIDPYHTSQTCSKCGHYEEGQRINQSTFTCKICEFATNADYNAARNIAKSEKYIKAKEESEYYKKVINNLKKGYMRCELREGTAK